MARPSIEVIGSEVSTPGFDRPHNTGVFKTDYRTADSCVGGVQSWHPRRGLDVLKDQISADVARLGASVIELGELLPPAMQKSSQPVSSPIYHSMRTPIRLGLVRGLRLITPIAQQLLQRDGLSAKVVRWVAVRTASYRRRLVR